MELADVLKVVLAAMLPISELRGAIPLAVTVFGIPWYYAYIIAIIGNLIPVPIILLCLDWIARLAGKVRLLDRMLQWLFRSVRRRGRHVERYEHIGLALFVAIPLPITGAWTGSILAVLLGLRFRFAFLSILIGVLVAGGIVTVATMLGWSFLLKAVEG